MRIAKAVGAETAQITGAPSTAAFCTSSTDTRLVSSSTPGADAARLPPASDDRADKFIQGVMATDVLANEQAFLAGPGSGGMDRVGGASDRRGVKERVHGLEQFFRADGEGEIRDCRQRCANRSFEALDPAEAATCGAGQSPAPRRKTAGVAGGEPEAHLDANIVPHDLKIAERIRPVDDALREAEANRGIFQIGRGRHHHSGCRTVMHDSDGSFFRRSRSPEPTAPSALQRSGLPHRGKSDKTPTCVGTMHPAAGQTC